MSPADDTPRRAVVVPLHDDADLPWATAPAAAPEPPQAAEADHQPEPPHEPEREPEPPTDPSGWPFTLLGHDHGLYHYIGHDSKQVTILKASAHTSLNMLMLAPSSFWVRNWPKKGGFDADQAASDLIERQHRLGVYDPTRLRGRGAWWDRKTGTALVHLGDRLLINGAVSALHDHAGQFIYECAVPIPLDLGNALRNAEAKKLETICNYLSWEQPVYGRLLAGWIVCAQVCGGLRWRPHVWIQGPHRAGKSTIVDHIVARALGKSAARFVGGVTEPGIRNTLKSDARAIVIDDLDSSTQRAREQVQSILGLMRVFTGEDGGDVVKGSQLGIPTSTRINASWIFCSIVIEADKPADKSRVAELKVLPRKFEPKQLEELHARIKEALPEDFAPRFYARCVELLPVIRQNAETFAQAVGSKTGDRRVGDLYGALYAGAWSLGSRDLVTPEFAADYVGSREEIMALMAEQKQAVAENDEGDRCLAHLLEQIVTDTQDGRTRRASMYELLVNACHGNPEAEQLMRRHGIIPKPDVFLIANDHAMLRDLYAGTQWQVNWGGVLKTVRGAETHAGARFGSRVVRATRLPVSILAGKQPIPPPDDDEPPVREPGGE